MKSNIRAIGVFLCVLTASCVNHDIPELSPDYFVFGRFYGFCAGDCYDVFVLNRNSLYQSENESYPSISAPWSLPQLKSMSEDDRKLADEIPGIIPQSLLNTEEPVIGCPDCSDLGGIYIELNKNGEKRFWYIDNMVQDKDIKNFVVTVHKKMNLIVQ